jgi:endoglucanase
MRSWLLGALLLPALMGVANAEIPENRLTTLSRGVNVTSVFDMDSSFQQLLGDLPTIAGYGFHHIRIFVDPKWVTSWNPADARREHLDLTVDTAIRSGLGVILCMSGDNEDRWSESARIPDVEATWTSAWKLLIAHYRSVSPDKLFFELANEPTLSDVSRWANIQDGLRREIRKIAPHNTLLLTSTPDSTVWGLAQLRPVQDDDVVYTFHLYQPMVFTHQGAEWGDAEYASVRGLEYPPNTENIGLLRHKVKGSVVSDLMNYEKTGPQAIRREVQVGRLWAQKYNAHVIVTEFGVYHPAPSVSRAAWLQEARSSLEQAGFGWTVWEWNSGFGVKSGLMAMCAVQDSLRRALGFCR